MKNHNKKTFNGKSRKKFNHNPSYSNKQMNEEGETWENAANNDDDEEDREGSYYEGDGLTSVQKSKWYEEISERPSHVTNIPKEEIEILKMEASKILKDETLFHNAKDEKVKKGGDRAWIKTVFNKGTASDKVAAHVVTIQDAPVFSLSSLSLLVGMVNVGKKQSTSVIDTVAELFVTDLLPPTAKLLPFEKQPVDRLAEMSSGNAKTRRRHLMMWAFEDELKKVYAQFVQALNRLGHDTIDANKEKAVSVMHRLLAARPELEDVLLNNLANKLGDTSSKVASKAIYCLTQLLRQHEGMKQVVLNEIERLLFRSNISPKAQYYAICFLSQYRFTINDDELAHNIIKLYLAFFKACVKKGNIDSRMLGALLMGINRAYPYSKKNFDKMEDTVNTLYKMVHLANFNISFQCMSILFQISDSSQDRFYSALYRKLTEFDLAHSAHQAMIINLIYKAILKDTNKGRIQAFIKRLLQLSGLMPVPLACGLLYTVSQLIKRRPELYAVRLVPQAALNDVDEEDEEEYYKDVPLEEKPGEGEEVQLKTEEEKKERKPCSSWYHTALQIRRNGFGFDALARNPAYARGESAIYSELTVLTNHFHPTVALFSSNILENKTINYTGDPLIDFTFVRFVDRFVFKNPKQFDVAAQEKGPDPALAQRKYYTPFGSKALSTNSKNYLEQNEKDVPIDEVFLFRYLQHRKELGYRVAKKEDGDDDSDIESVASEEFEEMLNSMSGYKKADIDFAEEIGDKLSDKTSKKKKGAKQDDEDEDDVFGDSDAGEDEIDEDEDDEFDEENDDNISLDDDNGNDDIDLDDIEDDDDDAEVLEFGDDSDSEDEVSDKLKKKGINMKLKKGVSKLFAPAEQFSEMLEEAGASGYRTGTSQAVSNKDKAAVKQLEWEMKRNNNQWKKQNNKRKITRHFVKGKKRRLH